MHETHIANAIIKEAEKQGSVKKIQIEVGELAEVTGPEIKGAVEAATNWDVEIVELPGHVSCSCGYSGKASIMDKGHGYCYFNCPKCQKKPTVEKGGEIKITGIECA